MRALVVRRRRANSMPLMPGSIQSSTTNPAARERTISALLGVLARSA